MFFPAEHNVNSDCETNSLTISYPNYYANVGYFHSSARNTSMGVDE